MRIYPALVIRMLRSILLVSLDRGEVPSCDGRREFHWNNWVFFLHCRWCTAGGFEEDHYPINYAVSCE